MGNYRSARGRYFLHILMGAFALGLLLTFFFDAIIFSQDHLKTELRLIGAGSIDFIRHYYHIVLVGYVVVVGVIIFFENQNPNSTISWLVVLVFLPVLGLVCYWLLGPDLRYYSRRKKLALPNKQKAKHFKLKRDLDPFFSKTASLIYASSLAPLHENCRVTLFVDGKETYAAMLEKMRAAQKVILFQSFIITNDAIGETFKQVLAERARQGLIVCMLYDAVGSYKISHSSVKMLRQAGVHVYSFLPVAFPMFRGANYRNHRKTLVVDNEWGFMGGVNIKQYYLDPNAGQLPWRDTHCMIQGTAVQSLTETFVHDLVMCGAPDSLPQMIKQNMPEPKEGAPGTCTLQIATSGPDSSWDAVKKAYFSLLTTARKNIWITTPYLIPGSALQEALCTAALSGVDVRVLIPGEADHPMVFWASLHSCEELLRAGVRIYQYRADRFVHAKTMVCDSKVLSVGTANLDVRSLSINFESQAFIYDAALARQGEKIFLEDISHAKELVFDEWIKRPFTKKVLENIGKLITPLA